jgi:hypothetical protein
MKKQVACFFEIKEEHLKLLQRFQVEWQDLHSGAPRIEPKRPYGITSDVVMDIAKILDLKFIDENLENDEDQEMDKRLFKLHEETRTALQICLQTLRFEVGTYQFLPNQKQWIKLV